MFQITEVRGSFQTNMDTTPSGEVFQIIEVSSLLHNTTPRSGVFFFSMEQTPPRAKTRGGTTPEMLQQGGGGCDVVLCRFNLHKLEHLPPRGGVLWSEKRCFDVRYLEHLGWCAGKTNVHDNPTLDGPTPTFLDTLNIRL